MAVREGWRREGGRKGKERKKWHIKWEERRVDQVEEEKGVSSIEEIRADEYSYIVLLSNGIVEVSYGIVRIRARQLLCLCRQNVLDPLVSLTTQRK